MKYIFLAFICSVCLIACKSNYTKVGAKNANYIPYYLKVYEADSLYIVRDYQRSHDILDSLFKKYEPLNQESYGEYVTYLKSKILLKNFKNTKTILKKAIRDYGFKVEYCVNDTLISKVIQKSRYKEKDLKSFYDRYVKSLDLDYRYAIEEMIKDDQRVRIDFPNDHKQWEEVDKKNAGLIKMLVFNYGYPSVKKVGVRGFNKKSSNVHLLFLHATREARENYILKLMRESLKKGECEPSDFATVYDKYLYVEGKFGDKVLYGEFRNPKKSIDMLVVNPKKIDSIRKSIGLENIEYRRWKIMKLTGIDINDLNKDINVN